MKEIQFAKEMVEKGYEYVVVLPVKMGEPLYTRGIEMASSLAKNEYKDHVVEVKKIDDWIKELIEQSTQACLAKMEETRTRGKIKALGRTDDDELGESGSDYFVVPQFVGNDPYLEVCEEVAKALVQFEYGHHCGHTHDCCGCVFTNYPHSALFDEIGQNWIVVMSWARNI